MKITIAHLFYDLMNLYGESGNILALKKSLLSQGLDVDIKNISINNHLDLTDVDIIYIGSGTESNKLLALNYLKRHNDELYQAFISKKFFLVTGNAIELFGEKLHSQDQILDGMCFFDYVTIKANSRIVSECVFNFDKIKEKIIGFENHANEISDLNSPLFTVEKGFGYNKKAKVEGIQLNNFYGTYLIGPIFARNPEFLEYFVREVIKNKYVDFEFKAFDFDIEKKAHDKYLTKYN